MTHIAHMEPYGSMRGHSMSAGIKWMGQAQAALNTESPLTAALRARSGLPGFSAVATEPRGHLGPAISNSTGEASLFAKANLSASSDDVEPAHTDTTCCKHGNDVDNCDWYSHIPEGFICVDLVEGIGGCDKHGFNPHCCTPKDVGTAWALGGCH